MRCELLEDGRLLVCKAEVEIEQMRALANSHAAMANRLASERDELLRVLAVIRRRSAPTTHSWQSAQDAFKDIHHEARAAIAKAEKA